MTIGELTQRCNYCGFPMDTPQRAHDFIHQQGEALIEHRKEIIRLARAVEVAESMADVIEEPQSFGRGALGNLAKRFRKALATPEGEGRVEL